jgi:MFS family permease
MQDSTPQTTPPRGRLNPQKVIAVLSLIMALQMTGYVMILPLFPQRFDEFGAGVQALGVSAMAFAISSTLAAPLLGALADRFGRRPLVLGSLAAYLAAYIGFLLAPSAEVLIVMRGLAGAFTAGLIPAVTGLATDLAPHERRAQWISFVIGGASFGWMAGPFLGGVIFDRWGYDTALLVSIGAAILTLIAALLAVPESRPLVEPNQPARNLRPKNMRDVLASLAGSLPKSGTAYLLLFICFAVMFAWAFMEPEFYFFVYGHLGWSASMLGLSMSAYGLAMSLGEFGLGRLSDRWGRKPVMLAGLVLFSAQFLGLALLRDYVPLTISFAVAGLGNALFDPALTASILDISPSGQRARLLGFKAAAASSGSILGPALVVLVTSSVSTGSIFLISVGVVVLAIAAAAGLRLGARPMVEQPAVIIQLSQ